MQEGIKFQAVKNSKEKKPCVNNIMKLKCLEVWCKYEWDVDYPILKSVNNKQTTIRRVMWRKGLKFKEVTWFVVKCPICGGKYIDFK